MAIHFNVHETPQPKSRKGNALSHARAIPRSTKKMKNICDLVCERASIPSADVKAVLDSFVWIIGFSLEYGDHVELEDLGHFSPSLRTRRGPDGTFTVEVDGVNFRCSETLKRKLSAVKLHRESNPTGYPEQDRKQRMINYLQQNEHITTPTYSKLNDCSYYKASADLKKFVQEGVICQIGARTHTMYLLAEEKNNEA